MSEATVANLRTLGAVIAAGVPTRPRAVYEAIELFADAWASDKRLAYRAGIEAAATEVHSFVESARRRNINADAIGLLVAAEGFVRALPDQKE